MIRTNCSSIKVTSLWYMHLPLYAREIILDKLKVSELDFPIVGEILNALRHCVCVCVLLSLSRGIVIFL